MKRIIIMLLSLFCASCTSSLTEDEKKLVGAWCYMLDSSAIGDKYYKYLNLKEDRTGRNGIFVENDGSSFLAPYLNFPVINWKLVNDTLLVEYEMSGGIFSAPGKKDTTIANFLVKDFWLVKEVRNGSLEAIMINPEIPHSRSNVVFELGLCEIY